MTSNTIQRPYVWPRLSDIDWFIWEPVETAHIFEGDDLLPLRPEHWDACALRARHSFFAHIVVEVGRGADVKSVVRVPEVCTVRELLTAIHKFYMSAIPNEDAIADVSDDNCEYKDNVVQALRAGHTPRMYELNGSMGYVTPSVPGYRRHPMSCIGLVRFGNIYRLSNDVFELSMGS